MQPAQLAQLDLVLAGADRDEPQHLVTHPSTTHLGEQPQHLPVRLELPPGVVLDRVAVRVAHSDIADGAGLVRHLYIGSRSKTSMTIRTADNYSINLPTY